MFDVVMPFTGDAIVKTRLAKWLKHPGDPQPATREPVIAPLTRHLSIGFDLEILMSPDRRGGGGATQT